MKALLRADLYRLFRSKFFYILLIVSFALALITFLLYLAISEISEGEDGLMPFVMTAEQLQMLSFDGTIGYMAAIAAAIFVCGDYSGGGMRNKVVIGCGRRKIFYSKLIAISFASVCIYIAIQIVVFVLGGGAFGWEGASAYHVISRFIAGLFMSLACAAIFTSVALLVQKLSSSLIFGIVVIFAVTMIVSLLSVAASMLDSAAFDWIYKIFARLTPMGQNSLLMAGEDDYWVLTAISAAWVLLAVFAVPVWFKKRDIK